MGFSAGGWIGRRSDPVSDCECSRSTNNNNPQKGSVAIMFGGRLEHPTAAGAAVLGEQPVHIAPYCTTKPNLSQTFIDHISTIDTFLQCMGCVR